MAGTTGKKTKSKSGLVIRQTAQKKKELEKVKPVEPVPENRRYYCCACGRAYVAQKSNFSYSQSPLYKGNNSYLPICNHCLDNIVDQYIDMLGSEEKALRRVCMKWDIYCSDELIQSSFKVFGDRSRIRKIIKDTNLKQHKGKTYDTYLREIADNTIKTNEELEEYLDENDTEEKKEDYRTRTIERSVKLFGMGYTPDEYVELINHYKLLKSQTDNDDSMQEIYIKEACEKHILKMRCRDDVDKFDKISKSYTQSVKEANLKKGIKMDMNDSETAWGKFEEIIEKYSPAEYYKDKQIFEDYDKFGEYYDRHIGRPTDNLINGTSNLDPEYLIKDKQGDEDES